MSSPELSAGDYLKERYGPPSKMVVLPALAGIVCIAIGTFLIETYGLFLFLGAPFIVGVGSGVGTRLSDRGIRQAFESSITATFCICLGLVCFAIEGVICVAMASPILAGMGILGARTGFELAKALRPTNAAKTFRAILVIAVLLQVGGMATEEALRSPAAFREVRTEILIQAPIDTVWNQVIDFGEIPEAPSGILRTGFAYPVAARIEGEGVGAIRYCEFSTGPFIEPITVWDPPHRLEFDVTSNPSPMREWSPWPGLHPPHLEDRFTSSNGRFLLVQEGDAVRLIGETVYRHDLSPSWYWGFLSDEIIHRIHLRVLEHIKRKAERVQ